MWPETSRTTWGISIIRQKTTSIASGCRCNLNRFTSLISRLCLIYLTNYTSSRNSLFGETCLCSTDKHLQRSHGLLLQGKDFLAKCWYAYRMSIKAWSKSLTRRNSSNNFWSKHLNKKGLFISRNFRCKVTGLWGNIIGKWLTQVHPIHTRTTFLL